MLASPPMNTLSDDDVLIYVHAQIRDFRYRCRGARAWASVAAAPTSRLLVSDVAAEAERTLADQAAADPPRLATPRDAVLHSITDCSKVTCCRTVLHHG